jgi:hypothetical protein
VLAIAVIAVAIPIAGCGTDTFDQTDLENAVVSAAPPDIQADSASCPSDVSTDTGTTFECTVTTASGDVTANGEVTGLNGDTGEFDVTYEPAGGASGATGEEGSS